MNATDIRRLYRKMAQRGLKDRSIEYVHTTLRKSLKAAFVDRLINHNPTDGIRPLKTPTGAAKDSLALTPRALEALKAHKVRQNEERLQAGSRWQDHNLVFPNTVGKPANAGNLYRRDFQPLLERAGLAEEGFTIHSLRHTFATTLAARGVYPSTAQKMLRHSDIRITLAIYTHATDGMQDAATDALEVAFD